MDNLAGKSVNDVVIEKATTKDIPVIKSIVEAAYSKYIERLGKPPGPMQTDYNKLVQETETFYILRFNENVVGSIIFLHEGDSMMINNIVVDTSTQGRGFGRLLMKFAEDASRAQGLKALELSTNVKMWENLEIYKKMGFVEIGRRMEDGYDRVFFRKDLT